MVTIDLSGGKAKIIGNLGDEHVFQLVNPVGQDIINVDGEYEADFTSYLGGANKTPVTLDSSQKATGTLSFPVTIQRGIYRVRRLNPRRTIIMIEVEAK